MADDILHIVIAGHVDHGKSTLIGRLFHDTGSLPEERYAEIRATCERQGREFEFAYLTDALEEERTQNVTIDTAQTFFRSRRRPYVIIDAPGHKEFLKNMITGAASADAAVLLVDGVEGVREQTRRHAYILSLLGVDQVVVAVNKMDLVGRAKERFHAVEAGITAFLHSVGISPSFVVPCSAREGENIATRSASMSWYSGPCLLEALDSFEPRAEPARLPFRFPVQDVYRWDNRRVYAGRVESGTVRKGDAVSFSPSGKRTRIAGLEKYGESVVSAGAGECIGLTLADELFVERGEVVCTGAPAEAAVEIRASVFWLGSQPLRLDGQYVVKLATGEVEARVTAIEERIDSSTLEVVERYATKLESTEVANVVLVPRKPIAAETFEANPLLGRFVLVDGRFVAGGGIVRQVRGEASGAARRVLTLDSIVDTEPHGNLVDLTGDRGVVELSASADFLERLAAGERVLFRLRGPWQVEPLARLAWEHGLSFVFTRSEDGGSVLLKGSGKAPSGPEGGGI